MLLPLRCRSQCCLLLLILPPAHRHLLAAWEYDGSMSCSQCLWFPTHKRNGRHFLPPIIRHDGVYLSFLWWSSAFSMGFPFFRQKAQTDRNWGTFAMTSKRYVFLSPSVPDFFHSFHPLAFRSRKEMAISDSLTNLNIRTLAALPSRAARPLIL